MSSSSVSSAVASASSSAVASTVSNPASYKVIGVVLAITSGLFIGSSFVFKKKGLLSAHAKSGIAPGEGNPYLKSPMWWTGMILMIVGEICNFVAYAFTEALLVTPLGALSVVICAILSSIFLGEKLTFFGKIGCLLAILGATIVALNGPQETTTNNIPAFQKLFLSPGFLAYGGVVIVTCLVLVFFVAPKHGKTNMLVYISICSLIGGLSVACTQGLGSSILTSIRGDNQFKHWFMYFLMGFVVCTLGVEIVYLNKALALFNTAMVTPTYYVMFTGATLVTSVILYQGFKATAIDIVTVVMGFLVICAGITLLQLSKVDPNEIKGKLDRKSTILLYADRPVHRDGDAEKGLQDEDPGMDALRGTFGAIGSIHRAISGRRSMRRDGAFDPSEIVRRRNGGGSENSSALGMGVVRHQLFDNPMPNDAADKISLYSAGLPSPQFPSGDNRERTASISFAAQDVHHLYPTSPSAGAPIHEQVKRGSTHMHGPRDARAPPSADIGASFPPASSASASFPGGLTLGSSSADAYADPYADLGERKFQTMPRQGKPESADYGKANRDFSASDPQLSPSTSSKSSRFPLPFSSTSSRAHRVAHPSGPAELDRAESASLVDHHRRDSESDEGEFEGGFGEPLEEYDTRDSERL